MRAGKAAAWIVIAEMAAVSSTRASLVWNQETPLPSPNTWMGAAAVDSRIYVVAGTTKDVLEYNHQTRAWTYKAPFPDGACVFPNSVTIDSIIWVVGSDDNFGTAFLSHVWSFDPSSNVWSPGPSFPGTYYPRVAVAAGGRIYTYGQSATEYLFMELDPGTGTWAQKADVPTPRICPAMASVDGIVYVIGGADPVNGGWLRTVEAYDPARDKWSKKMDIPVSRGDSPGATSSCGKIYVVMGPSQSPDFDPFDAIQVYDPVTDTWTTDTKLTLRRYGLGFTDDDGMLYAIGGLTWVDTPYWYGTSTTTNYVESTSAGDPGLFLGVNVPATVSVGQGFVVTASVTNPGRLYLAAVSTPMSVSPDAKAVTLLSGPSPASLERVSPGGSGSFTWALVAAAPGPVLFTITATGQNPLSGAWLSRTVSAAVLIQTPAKLEGALAAPWLICSGVPFDVTLTVTNTGEAPAVAMAANQTLGISGTISAVKLSGPSAVGFIGGGSSAVFTWTYSAVAEGSISFTASATGKDGNAGWALGTGLASTGLVPVVGPAVLTVSAYSPSLVPVGGSFTLSFTVTNTGGIQAVGVTPLITISPPTAPVLQVGGISPSWATLTAGSGTTFASTYAVTGWGRVALAATASGLDACHAVTGSSTVVVDLGTAAGIAGSVLTAQPDPVCVGAQIVIMTTVTNTGQVPANALTGSEQLEVTGTGAVVLVSSPVSVTLLGGASANLTWVYEATSAGTVLFSATVTGTDARDGSLVSTGPLGSNAVTVTAPAFLISSAPLISGTVVEGQWIDVTLTVTNTGGNPAEGVMPDWSAPPGPATVEVAVGPSPPGPVQVNAGAMATFTWTLSASGSGVVDLGLEAAGTTCGGLAVTGSAVVPVLVRRPGKLVMDKLTLGPSLAHAGSVLTSELGLRNGGDLGLTVSALNRTEAGTALLPSGDVISLPFGLSAGSSLTLTWTHLTRTWCGWGKETVAVTGSDDMTGRATACTGTSEAAYLYGDPAEVYLASSSLSANAGTGVVLTARLVDACGYGVPGFTLDFDVVRGGGSLSSLSGVTDAAGRSSVTLTLGALAGENEVMVKFVAASLSAIVTVKGTNPLALSSAGAGLSANVLDPGSGDGVVIRLLPVSVEPVVVRIYTASGRLIRTLRSLRNAGEGQWQTVWDGKTEERETVARGVYLVHVTGGGLDEKLKIVVR